jgi:uncharacterized membrane protein YozB (DUF420 family)
MLKQRADSSFEKKRQLIKVIFLLILLPFILLALVVVPVAYDLLDDLQLKFMQRKSLSSV